MATDLLPPLSYTDVELESYLPSGWVLADAEPHWHEDKSAFHVAVVDGSELEWDLWVPKAAADRHEALRLAVDKLDRGRFKSFL